MLAGRGRRAPVAGRLREGREVGAVVRHPWLGGRSWSRGAGTLSHSVSSLPLSWPPVKLGSDQK